MGTLPRGTSLPPPSTLDIFPLLLFITSLCTRPASHLITPFGALPTWALMCSGEDGRRTCSQEGGGESCFSAAQEGPQHPGAPLLTFSTLGISLPLSFFFSLCTRPASHSITPLCALPTWALICLRESGRATRSKESGQERLLPKEHEAPQLDCIPLAYDPHSIPSLRFSAPPGSTRVFSPIWNLRFLRVRRGVTGAVEAKDAECGGLLSHALLGASASYAFFLFLGVFMIARRRFSNPPGVGVVFVDSLWSKRVCCEPLLRGGRHRSERRSSVRSLELNTREFPW